MVKTTDDEQETLTAGFIKYQNYQEVVQVDADGNIQCRRCKWTHTTTECAEYRLANAQRELEKVNRFLHAEVLSSVEGESPVDTLLRWYKIRAGTEVTDLMKEE
jgi:hypothetical protein